MFEGKIRSMNHEYLLERRQGARTARDIFRRKEIPTSTTDSDIDDDRENLNKKPKTTEIEDPAASESSAVAEIIPSTALDSSPSPPINDRKLLMWKIRDIA